MRNIKIIFQERSLIFFGQSFLDWLTQWTDVPFFSSFGAQGFELRISVLPDCPNPVIDFHADGLA
jgi:hypothetical protein